MRDASPNIMLRRQNVERRALAPVVGVVNEDADTAEPAFSERLCKLIVAFWRSRGVVVRAWVEYQRKDSNNPDTRSLYVIRSIGIPGART